MKGCTDKLRKRVQNNDYLVFGCIHDSHSGAVVEAYHEAGYDVILIDREHTPFSLETVTEHIRLARALEIPVMVRAADHAYHEIARTLDQGPDGIFVPRVSTRQQAQDIADAVRYPPLGKRGLGGVTCPVSRYVGWPAIQDQIAYVNRDVVLGIQIETAAALEDLDGILSVPGIDMALIGNDDLSIGMGIPGQLQHPDYIAAVDRMIAACRRHGVLPGIAGGAPEFVRFWAQHGMRAFWAASDIYSLWQGARAQMKLMKETLRDVP